MAFFASMGSMLSPLRSLAREARRNAGFLPVVVITLGVGLGANMAIFSVVDGVLIRPLPYPEPERLVGIWHTAPGLQLDRLDLSDGTYLLYRQGNRVLEDFGIYASAPMNLSSGAAPERLNAAVATGSVFSTLRVPAALGRTIQAADEKPGGEKLAVLSHALWQRRFGGDPKAVGATLRLDGIDRRIVGVMPAGFRFPDEDTELWLPKILDPSHLSPGSFNYKAVGRLRPGISPASAARQLAPLVRQIPEVYGEQVVDRQTIEKAGFTLAVTPLRDEIVGNVERALWVLLGSVACILLIACANVANLFLVRAEGRQREIAVRTALGSTRGGIAWIFFSESLALALLGGLLGLLLAVAGVRLLLSLQPQGIPRLAEIGIDGRTLLFALLASLFAGLLCGGLAALRSATPALVPALKEGGRGGTAGRGRHRANNVLVAAQVALALMLLVDSGLMVKSFRKLRQVDPGLAPGKVLSLQIDLPYTEYGDTAAIFRFIERLLEGVRAVPGVKEAGVVFPLPLSGTDSGSGYWFQDLPLPPGQVPPRLANRFATPAYFATLGIPVVEGRLFGPLDPLHRTTEAMVSRSLAEHFWPGQSAIGKRLTASSPGMGPWYTVVGVVGDVRDRGLHDEPVQAVYFPMLRFADGMEWAPSSFSLVVQGNVDPTSLAAPVRSAVKAVDPNLPVSRIEPLDEVVARSMARTSFTMLLLVLAAAVALFLGAVGLYGVIAYVVSQRTREIGVRMALGAARSDISRMVLRDGLLVTLLGIAAGIGGALALTRLLRSLLYGVSPFDLATFGVVSALLAAVALCASWLPASQAARTEPLEAIRHE
jgi:putative ABC transport system permease protein